MFLTRMGKSAKFIVTGDMSNRFTKKSKSGLKIALDLFQNIKELK